MLQHAQVAPTAGMAPVLFATPVTFVQMKLLAYATRVSIAHLALQLQFDVPTARFQMLLVPKYAQVWISGKIKTKKYFELCV